MGETEDQREQTICPRLHSKRTKTELSSNLPPIGELTEGSQGFSVVSQAPTLPPFSTK